MSSSSHRRPHIIVLTSSSSHIVVLEDVTRLACPLTEEGPHLVVLEADDGEGQKEEEEAEDDRTTHKTQSKVSATRIGFALDRKR